MPIALDRFIEAKRGDSVDFCQVAIQHHTSAADRANHSINLLDRNGRFGFLRHWRERLFRNSLGEKLLLEWSDVSAFASAMARPALVRLRHGKQDGEPRGAQRS